MEIQNLILENEFYHQYQPVYDIQSGKLLGYEGLFRADHILNPEKAFNLAKKKRSFMN